MGKTPIEWTDQTLNPIRARNLETGAIGWHCEHVNPDCINCFAEGINRRLGTGLPFKPGHRKDVEIFLDDDMIKAALEQVDGKPQRIFITSMTDTAASFVSDEMLAGIFAFAGLAAPGQVQILTKRPERLADFLLHKDADHLISAALGNHLDGDWIWSKKGKRWRKRIERGIEMALGHDDQGRQTDDLFPMQNVWLGFSAGTQAHFDAMWAEMRPLAEDGWNIFASLEPLHEAITLPADFLALCERAWVIVGGESKGQPSSKPRPTHPAWVRALQRQCAGAGVWFFFKQWGHWLPGYDRERDDPDWRRCDAVARETPKGQWLNNTGGQGFHGMHVVRISPVGKKAAGAELDGQLYQQLPPLPEAA